MGSNESQNSDNYNFLKETTLTDRYMKENNLYCHKLEGGRISFDQLIPHGETLNSNHDGNVYLKKGNKIFQVETKKIEKIVELVDEYSSILGISSPPIEISFNSREGTNADDNKITINYRDINTTLAGISDSAKNFILAHEISHHTPDQDKFFKKYGLNDDKIQEAELDADTKGAKISNNPEGALELFNKMRDSRSKSLIKDLRAFHRANGTDPDAPNHLSEQYGREMQNYGSAMFARMLADKSGLNYIENQTGGNFYGSRDNSHPAYAERIENIERNFHVKLQKSQGIEMPEDRKPITTRYVDGKEIDLSDAVGGMKGLRLDTKLSHEDLTSRIGNGIQAPAPVVAPEPPSPSLKPGK